MKKRHVQDFKRLLERRLEELLDEAGNTVSGMTYSNPTRESKLKAPMLESLDVLLVYTRFETQNIPQGGPS